MPELCLLDASETGPLRGLLPLRIFSSEVGKCIGLQMVQIGQGTCILVAVNEFALTPIAPLV